jgi:hypothetical protein
LSGRDSLANPGKVKRIEQRGKILPWRIRSRQNFFDHRAEGGATLRLN